MKKTIAAIALLAITAAAAGCDTAAPGDEPGPGPAQPTATGPSVEEIEAARQDAARNLSAENADLAVYANEPLSLPPASPAPIQTTSDIEAQSQAISWGCRIAFYGNPTWWSGVFGLQALKSAGLITSYNQCRSVVGSAGALSAFLARNNRTWQYAVLSFLVIAGGSCACDYVW